MSGPQKPNKPGKALDRLAQLEGQVQMMGQVLNAFFQQIGTKLGEQEEILRAVTETIGEDEVKAVIKGNRLAAMEERKKRSQDVLKRLVDKGVATKVDKIEEQAVATKKTLVVLHELEADGTVKEPGYAAMFLEQFTEDARKQLLGQGAGFSFVGPEGVSANVDEVYVIDQELEQKLLAEEKLAAETAAAAAAPTGGEPAAEAGEQSQS